MFGQEQAVVAGQQQKLVMTPELYQSLVILQMPLLQLEAYINQQLAENCLLEQTVDQLEGALDQGPTEPAPASDRLLGESFNPSDWDDYCDPGAPELQPDSPASREFREQAPSLQDFLLAQLGWQRLSQAERHIAEYLIGNINDDAYLECEIAEAARKLKARPEEVEPVLQIIQTFEPAGVGARDLKECLLLQLSSAQERVEQQSIDDRIREITRRMIKEHLYDIADGNYRKIVAGLQISLREAQQGIELIRSLDPKPGRNYGCLNHQFIVPDVAILKLDNEYTIVINEPPNGRLGISPAYRQLLREAMDDEPTVQFLKAKHRAATQLIKQIMQRHNTLYQITECLMTLQTDFFAQGSLQLKPLTLRQLAQAAAMHQSTVSRAISGKLLATPRGLYPYKFFLTAALNTPNGDTVSAAAVKRLLKKAIAAEAPTCPLSDQQLSEWFQSKDITVSRRTVAKYREVLGIPPSTKRKRLVPHS